MGGFVRVGIVGCGLIGQKRAKSLGSAQLVATADLDFAKAQALAGSQDGAIAMTDWQKLVARPDVDIVIVATTNDALAQVTLAAIQSGKHVLVEKPAARNVDEIQPVLLAAEEQGVQVRVGFNHRYHPAFLEALRIYKSGILGDLMFIRGRYGHGGRLGYEKEWRANPDLSGGGELLDQGVHLIDLSRLFLGDFSSIQGFVHTYYWDMLVEDNGFMLLRTEQNQVSHLHVSWTEWKNLFSFEIYGRNAKLHVEGLGGSYGVERLSLYKMLPEMGPPETTIWEYPGFDQSWDVEFAEFMEDIRLNRMPAASLKDAAAALSIVQAIYQGR